MSPPSRSFAERKSPDAAIARSGKAQRKRDVDEAPPFKDFQSVLGFLASIGLATTSSIAFSLSSSTSTFGDSSENALAEIKKTAVLLSWASACFIVALAFIIAPQLLYTEIVIVQIITQESMQNWAQRIVRASVGIFAWVPLGFQVAAMLLFSEALRPLAPGSVLLARYGIITGASIVASVTLIGILSNQTGRAKFFGFLTCGKYSSSVE